MLIDVALPDMSGFDVLHGAGKLRAARHTTRACRTLPSAPWWKGAVDYLIKPVGVIIKRAIALVRQRQVLEAAAQAQLTRAVLESLGKRPKILVGERQHRLYPLDVEKIEYIEADGNYVTIRAANQEYISRDTIKRLSAELASFGFVRIDRSILLNIRAVQFAEPVGHGTLAFTLSSGACLHSSKTYRTQYKAYCRGIIVAQERACDCGIHDSRTLNVGVDPR